MKMLTNKNKTTATFITVILLISTFLLLTNITTQAQASEQQTTGPIPTGVTPSEIIDVTAYLSFRPNPIGFNQIF